MKRIKIYALLSLLAVAWLGVALWVWRSNAGADFAPVANIPTAPIACRGESFSGEVVAVLDGDTLDVMRDDRSERIRLHNVDAPEKAQAFGQRAKQFAADLVYGKTVTVCIADHDRYGRTVGDVILPDGRALNRELVASGFAWWYRRYSNDASFEQLETSARAAHRGLWADDAPKPPWDFRR